MKKKNGFTLIELVVLVVMAVGFASVLLTALSRADEENAKAFCQNTLMNVFLASSMYSQDYDGYAVPSGPSVGGTFWTVMLARERYGVDVRNSDAYSPPGKRCPAETRPRHASSDYRSDYGVNMYVGGHEYRSWGAPVVRLSQVEEPEVTVWYFDSNKITLTPHDQIAVSTSEPRARGVAFRHGEKHDGEFGPGSSTNWVNVAGNVENMTVEEIEARFGRLGEFPRVAGIYSVE